MSHSYINLLEDKALWKCCFPLCCRKLNCKTVIKGMLMCGTFPRSVNSAVKIRLWRFSVIRDILIFFWYSFFDSHFSIKWGMSGPFTIGKTSPPPWKPRRRKTNTWSQLSKLVHTPSGPSTGQGTKKDNTKVEMGLRIKGRIFSSLLTWLIREA